MNIVKNLYNILKEHLDLSPDKEDEQKVIDNVRRGVEFRGVNLWILIFAVLIASIGLNVDSTPIIIGAMLISPLMGPIIGTGLAVGINDTELLKRSLHNLLVAALFGIGTATLYFIISPLNETEPELLAHTSPTLYDVMIALLGGAAGFLAMSSIGNHIQVIVGVAISTALMPPLCTVGLGIATGHWLYALRAFYLVFINSTFIAISTFLFVRLFNFSRKEFVDEAHKRKVSRSIIIISVVALIPSVIFTYGIIRNNRNLLFAPAKERTGIYDYSTEDSHMFDEIKILFPYVSGVSLGYLWERNDSTSSAVKNMTIIIDSHNKIPLKNRETITRWLRQRMENKALQVVFVEDR